MDLSGYGKDGAIINSGIPGVVDPEYGNTRSKSAGKAVLELGVSTIGAKALNKILKADKFSGAGRLSNYVDEIGRYSDDVIKRTGKAGDSLRKGYKSSSRSTNLLKRDKFTKKTQQLTEWRRSIDKGDIGNQRKLFLGDDYVKVGEGKWRSLDGSRQFRVKPDDYLGKHGIGRPLVPNTPHAHFEFLQPKGNKFEVIKNIHVPLE